MLTNRDEEEIRQIVADLEAPSHSDGFMAACFRDNWFAGACFHYDRQGAHEGGPVALMVDSVDTAMSLARIAHLMARGDQPEPFVLPLGKLNGIRFCECSHVPEGRGPEFSILHADEFAGLAMTPLRTDPYLEIDRKGGVAFHDGQGRMMGFDAKALCQMVKDALPVMTDGIADIPVLFMKRKFDSGSANPDEDPAIILSVTLRDAMKMARTQGGREPIVVPESFRAFYADENAMRAICEAGIEIPAVETFGVRQMLNDRHLSSGETERVLEILEGAPRVAINPGKTSNPLVFSRLLAVQAFGVSFTTTPKRLANIVYRQARNIADMKGEMPDESQGMGLGQP